MPSARDLDHSLGGSHPITLRAEVINVLDDPDLTGPMIFGQPT